MTDWTASSRVKIERAKEHVYELESAVNAFLQCDPYEINIEREPQSGDLIYRLKIAADPPPRLGAIIGDAVHNLRSALDVMICQLYETATGKSAPRSLYFPIYDTRHEFESKRLREIQRASPEAVEIIKELKPYRFGSEPLWVLQSLNNRDKHHVLTAVGSALSYMSVDFIGAAIRPVLARVPWHLHERVLGFIPRDPIHFLTGRKTRFCPLKDGDILHRWPAGFSGIMELTPEFTFSIAFAEGDLVHAQPVVPTVHQLTHFVKGIVEIFASEITPLLARGDKPPGRRGAG